MTLLKTCIPISVKNTNEDSKQIQKLFRQQHEALESLKDAEGVDKLLLIHHLQVINEDLCDAVVALRREYSRSVTSLRDGEAGDKLS